MLKRFLFAVAPMMLVAGSVMADDSLLSKVASMDLNDTKIAAAEVADLDDLGQTDVDALLGDDEDASSEEAVAACFGRIGWGYRYRSHYRSCYRPFYRSYSYCNNYSYYPSYQHYTPVTYSCYTPIYRSYWGCW
jgi:hypothetical protein